MRLLINGFNVIYLEYILKGRENIYLFIERQTVNYIFKPIVYCLVLLNNGYKSHNNLKLINFDEHESILVTRCDKGRTHSLSINISFF